MAKITKIFANANEKYIKSNVLYAGSEDHYIYKSLDENGLMTDKATCEEVKEMFFSDGIVINYITESTEEQGMTVFCTPLKYSEGSNDNGTYAMVFISTDTSSLDNTMLCSSEYIEP